MAVQVSVGKNLLTSLIIPAPNHLERTFQELDGVSLQFSELWLRNEALRADIYVEQRP